MHKILNQRESRSRDNSRMSCIVHILMPTKDASEVIEFQNPLSLAIDKAAEEKLGSADALKLVRTNKLFGICRWVDFHTFCFDN